MISALVTALGTIAAYKLKKTERVLVTGTPVKILSLKDRRSFRYVSILKIGGYTGIATTLLWAALVIWWYDLEIKWIITIIVACVVVVAIYLFILSKIRGDLSGRRSRTKYDTTVTVKAPYDAVLARALYFERKDFPPRSGPLHHICGD
jgi:hypothetical protein